MALVTHAIFLEPLNASLNTWGSKVLGHSPEFALGLQADPISFDTHFKSKSSGDTAALAINIAFVLACVAFLLVCLVTNDGNECEDIIDDTLLQQKVDSLREVQGGGGSWAQAFRDAQGEEREALELLFRCHIISTYEFAESRVGQDHIDECVLIAMHMLLQKPLTDWVAMRHQAKQVFEENTVACFQARSDSRSTRQWSRTPTPPPPLQTLASLQSLNSISTESSLSSIGTAPQLKVPPRIQIPRMDLLSLSPGKGQSSKEDDDDPYTTRDMHADDHDLNTTQDVFLTSR